MSRNWFFSAADWPDDGIRLWLAESDVSWRVSLPWPQFFWLVEVLMRLLRAVVEHYPERVRESVCSLQGSHIFLYFPGWSDSVFFFRWSWFLHNFQVFLFASHSHTKYWKLLHLGFVVVQTNILIIKILTTHLSIGNFFLKPKLVNILTFVLIVWFLLH